jgi:FMN phosphatase YigB (HAD superfamily)
MSVRAVFFDVGETLVDETGSWSQWAEWLGVTRLTLFAALGAVVARGGRHREVFELVRPDLDFREVLRQRADGRAAFTVDDLYPDALPCLRAVRELGYRVGIAANQPPEAAGVLRRSGLTFEWLLISDVEGVHKPDPAFFARMLQVSGLPADAIAYVGDRVDNDVVPAAEAGMVAVHVRRGPWGVLQWDWPGAERAALRVGSLAELPDRLGPAGAGVTDVSPQS